MSEFDDREKAAEARFARDGEMRFKTMARANRLLGLWAAGRMGLSGDAARSYADALVELGAKADSSAADKVLADLSVLVPPVSVTEIRAKMAELTDAARAQVASD